MRVTVHAGGRRETYEFNPTVVLGGDGDRLVVNGNGAWRGRFVEQAISRALHVATDARLPTLVDGVDAGRTIRLRPGLELTVGDVRMIIDYEDRLAPSTPLSAIEQELLARIAGGDDDAAIVLADHWGGGADPAWFANLRTAGFEGVAAIPPVIEEDEPLARDADTLRIAPRRYLLRVGFTEATIAGARVNLHLGDEAGDRILAALDHPNIVRRVGPIDHRRGIGYATAWAGTRADMLGVIGEAHAIAIGRQLCEALRALVPLRLVHQRIAPWTVFVDGDRARLGGFAYATTPGLAYQREAALSPEQASGRAVSQATDVFALAALLVGLATGTSAFPRDGTYLERLAACEPLLRGQTPLIRLARRTLVADPARRPSLDEFQAALR